jgi:hypothetical protein
MQSGLFTLHPFAHKKHRIALVSRQPGCLLHKIRGFPLPDHCGIGLFWMTIF